MLKRYPAYLLWVLVSWLGIFLLTRSALLVSHLNQIDIDSASLLKIYSVGMLYDLAFLAYAAVPLGLLILLIPNRLWRWPALRLGLHGLYGISLFAMFFIAVCEWIFWDEFGVRFNFISVDYLVYSDEVLNNILQSYPVFTLVAGLAALSLMTTWLFRRLTNRALSGSPLPWRHRTVAFSLLLLPAAMVTLLGQGLRDKDNQVYRRELASNGPYQFFAAFRNNELDYAEFYPTLPAERVGNLLRREIAENNSEFIGSDPMDIRRRIDNPGEEHHFNIILVTVESLSAKYLGSFGAPHDLTPNLDQLRQQSLFFNNFYATGTRTTRGLEAITLSIPPTPGRSIVKRIGRESGFASLGQQLKQRGYDSLFVYGGRGYFDNMNAFFQGNGYRVVDQDSVPAAAIHFENAWGMADEDLYDEVIRLADADHAQGKPFFPASNDYFKPSPLQLPGRPYRYTFWIGTSRCGQIHGLRYRQISGNRTQQTLVCQYDFCFRRRPHRR